MTGAETLSLVVRARTALVRGDLSLATDLLADLERALRPRKRGVCPECSIDCEWPGRLEEHLRVFHPEVWEATVAA